MKQRIAQDAARRAQDRRRRAGRLPGRNERFYRDGIEYLGHLRRLGRTDYPFEDEMYYTMQPASPPAGGPAACSRPAGLFA